MRATLQFFSCIFGCFKNALAARQCDVSFLKALVMYSVLSLEKNPASPSWKNCIWNCWIYGRPAGFFTKMLRFDKKFQRNFSEISLQLLKLLSIKKREILEKSRQNKFIISGFNGSHRNDKKSPG
jgi:hypothetical protein